MVFSNFRIGFQSREIPMGQANAAVIGQCESGGHYLYLTAPRKVGHFIQGYRPDLVISDEIDVHTRRVHKTDKSDNRYLILSTRPDGWKREFCHGYVAAPAQQKHELLDCSESTARFGSKWDEVILRVQPGDIFAVVTTGSRPQRCFYLVSNDDVLEANFDTVNDAYRALDHQLHQDKSSVHHSDITDHLWCNVTDPSLIIHLT